MNYKLLIIISLLFIVGCSKGDTSEQGVESGEAVVFKAADNWGDETSSDQSTTTRGALLNGAFVNGNTFSVFGYHLEDGEVWSASSSKPDFMFNQKVEYDGADWSYSPVKYWSNNSADNYRFYGYAPYSESITPSENSKTGVVELTYLPVVDEDETNTVNSPTMIDFVTSKTYIEANKAAPDVVFNFEHQLAQFRFSMRHNGGKKTEDGKTGDKVKVKGVTITGIYPHKGAFDATNGAFTWDAEMSSKGESVECVASVGNGGLKDEYVVNDTDVALADKSYTLVTESNGAIMMSPQTFANYDSDLDGVNDKIKLSVDFNIVNSHSASADDGEGISVATDVIFDKIVVEKGYIYNLRFSLDVVGYESVDVDVDIVREVWKVAGTYDFPEVE